MEPKHHVNQSINVLYTFQDGHFSSVYLMNIRFYLIDLKCSTDYIKTFGIPNGNNKSNDVKKNILAFVCVGIVKF